METESPSAMPPFFKTIEFVGGLRKATPAEEGLFATSADFKTQIAQACAALAVVSSNDSLRQSYMTRCVETINTISDASVRKFAEKAMEGMLSGTPLETLYRDCLEIADLKRKIEPNKASKNKSASALVRVIPTSMMVVVLLAAIILLNRNSNDDRLAGDQFEAMEILVASVDGNNRSIESSHIRDLELYQIPNVASDRPFGWSFHFFVPSKQEDQSSLEFSLRRHASNANGSLSIGYSGQVDNTNGTEIFLMVLSDRDAMPLADPDCEWLTEQDRKEIRSAQSDAEYATVIHRALRRLGWNYGYDLQLRALQHVDP